METKIENSLIVRYLAAVSDLLPARQRKDTITEIRSLIQDALDDRSKVEGKEPDDEMVASVLKEFGSPEKIVSPYLPEKYLIGPRLYSTFILVLRIVLPIIAVLAFIGYWIGASQVSTMTSIELLTTIIKSFGTSLSSVVQAFGNIVVIFAIIQWALPEFKLESKEKEWDPHTLKEIKFPDKVSRGELITEIVFSLVGLIIFNFYLDRIGVYNFSSPRWTFTPILTDAFNAYIPWLDLFWILAILLNSLILRKGTLQVSTRLFSIAMSAFSIALASAFISQIPILYTLKGAMGASGAEGILESLLNQVMIIVLLIVIITNLVKMVRMALPMLKSRMPV